MRLIIRDGTEPGGRGGLEFDLREVLLAVEEQSRRCTWRGRHIHYVSRDDCDFGPMHSLGQGRAVAGDDLVDGIGQLLQVIDGEFEATEPGRDNPSFVIRARSTALGGKCYPMMQLCRAAIRRRFRPGDAMKLPSRRSERSFPTVDAALVEARYVCGGLWGYGWYVLLETRGESRLVVGTQFAVDQLAPDAFGLMRVRTPSGRSWPRSSLLGRSGRGRRPRPRQGESAQLLRPSPHVKLSKWQGNTRG